MIPPERVHVIGATGRSGAALCRALAAAGGAVVAVVRDVAKFRAMALPGEVRRADLTDAAALREALADATHVASAAYAWDAPAVIAAAPPAARLALLGTTRKYASQPDRFGAGAEAGERALLASGRDAVILHATMIYGAAGETNMRRLAALMARLPLLPLPGGGRNLVQPIHQDDVTRALLAALARPWPQPQALTIAGPAPLPYADFARAVAAAARLAPPRILPVPVGLALALARVGALLPGLPRVQPAEIRRLVEDKAFDAAPMIAALGFTPIDLAEGLARSFGGEQTGASPAGGAPCP